jgi:hypothetical protein
MTICYFKEHALESVPLSVHSYPEYVKKCILVLSMENKERDLYKHFRGVTLSDVDWIYEGCGFYQDSREFL